jgi:hypothetical protein
MTPKDVSALVMTAATLVTLAAAFRSKSDPEAERRRKLAAVARKLQLQFNPKNDLELPEKFPAVTWLRRGEGRYAYNVMHGPHSGYALTVFDYTFATTGGKGNNYYWSAFVMELRANFPDLTISPESAGSRLMEIFGGPHITFESVAFSHNFRVQSADKKFATEVCHPKMMEYLLTNRDLTIEINGPILALIFEDWLRPETVETNVLRLTEIRTLLPHYLFTNS